MWIAEAKHTQAYSNTEKKQSWKSNHELAQGNSKQYLRLIVETLFLVINLCKAYNNGRRSFFLGQRSVQKKNTNS